MALAVYVCLLLVWSCLSSCAAILPSYIPVIQANHVQRDDLIRKYFHLGFNYANIPTGHLLLLSTVSDRVSLKKISSIGVE